MVAEGLRRAGCVAWSRGAGMAAHLVRNDPLATSGLLAWSLRGPRFQGRQSACALVRNWYKFSVEYSTIALFLSGDGPSCGSSGAGYALDGLDVAPGAAQTLGPQR